MKTDQVRESFLEFFAGKGHTIVPSDSLVPHKDPSLLFTGAGMNQFKENFLGLKKDLKRAASSQKCLRTGDLEEVGKTAFHHSFFEMLGNFSFGDYFKKEAIAWAWELMTATFKIPKERLRVSVHQNDEEAFRFWKDVIKIREDWIYRCGDRSNFWPSNAPSEGPDGPCGPCSEIYFDQDPARGSGGSIEDETGRFAEIWNLVFTQFDRAHDGKLVPLAQKNIDTGMGLERLACILQGKKTNYEIDIFQPIHDAAERNLNAKASGENRRRLYAVSDHLRAVVFSMADGVIPSNEGRGYVIRKLVRRALWQAHQLIHPRRVEEPFLYKMVPVVSSLMSKAYPELVEAEQGTIATLRGEEERFLDTLETGLRILNEKIAALKEKKTRKLPGDMVFELYDTYGFPDELTQAIADSEGLAIDQIEFERLMDGQRKRAKEASPISAEIFTASELEKKLAQLAATKFSGYQSLEADGKILLAEIKDGQGIVVLDETPFYAESGGQVGDRGILEATSFKARVTDAQKKDHYVLHAVEVLSGRVTVGDLVTAKVDPVRRESAMRNHTATHLVHAALRNILGKQVRQLGSLVSPDKLRFDYSYSQPLSAGILQEIEDSVNAQIWKDLPVSKEEKSIEEAKQEGAIAFFGEKYGSTVRVVTVPGYSKELCGGTHCDRTGQIGVFVITSDASIASGTRRIEALTGQAALDYTRSLRSQIGQLALHLKATPAELGERVAKIQETVKRLEKEKREGFAAKSDPNKILSEAKAAGKVQFLAHRKKGAELQELRQLSDALRSGSSKTVYFLGTENEDKIHFLLGMSHDLAQSGLDMRELGKTLSDLLKGNSGGRLDLVQGGAVNEGQLAERWQKIEEQAVMFLKGKNIS